MLVEKLSEIQNSHLKIRESIQFLEQSLSPQDYNDQTLLDDLYRNLEGLETPKIKLPIIGRVKAGKSTLLSAIMGPSSKAGFEDKPPLHIDTNEATAVVIDIEYGENVEVFLKKMNPDGNYDEKVIDYERYLEDYKVSIDAEENRRKFKNVIGFCVKYPNELLKSGLILQDLPGLEMHDERTEISLKVIRNSSFGVFVFNKHFTKDQDAASIFQEFRKENCRIITVFNDFGFDLRREQGRESKRIVVQQFYKLITGNTCIIKTIEEADEIIKELEEQYETFFVSAKSAWEGKLEGDQQEVISSGPSKQMRLPVPPEPTDLPKAA